MQGQQTSAGTPVSVHNTLTKRIQPFEPMAFPEVRFFVCGPTVYDYAHLGHAKTTVQFDFIVKYLRLRGYRVNYLQNITDIDDKIIDRARREGVGWQDISRKFEAAYLEDMAALGNDAVSRYARASEFIPQIVRQVAGLQAKGCAYRISDGVYFDLSTFPRYGCLSGRTNLQADDAVSRIDESAEKRNWNDFCLWKFRKPDEPFWETELGEGRPGWHIEDTAITESIFGPQYDMHGGAIDLIFPHHEAEICQMESLSGLSPFVRYWLHTGFLNINAEKMAKSKGNFLTIRAALERYDRRVIRCFFLSAHYRATINLTPESFDQARGSLDRINEFLFRADPDRDDAPLAEKTAALRDEVHAALGEDFDAPRALAAVYQFIRAANAAGDLPGKRCLEFFREIDQCFNMMSFPGEAAAEGEEEIRALVEERQRARQARDFAAADRIRDRLAAMGVQVYDSKEGVKWRRG